VVPEKEVVMKTPIAVIAAAGLMLAGGAGAAVDARAAEALAKKSGCFTCHAADKKLYGPSFKEIAARYKDDKNAETKLIDVIEKGGSGVWGPTPMPANSQIKDDASKTIEAPFWATAGLLGLGAVASLHVSKTSKEVTHE
jgi:cytochrome c